MSPEADPRVPRADAGFTLAELLTAFAMLGLTLAGITTAYRAAQQGYVIGATKTAVDQSARVALERMATEIRGAVPPVGGGATVTAGAASSITFNTAAGAVTYAVAAGALTRNGVALTGGVRTLTLAYRDANDAVLATPVGTPANIRRVDVTIQTQSENALIAADGSAYAARAQIMTSARLRNL